MNLQYLRPLKARYISEFYDHVEWRDSSKIEEYHNVKLLPKGQLMRPFPKYDGPIIVDDNDICTYIEKSEGDTDSIPYIAGRTFYGGYLRKIWGHFLLGTMPKFWPFVSELNPEDFDTVIFFTIDDVQEVTGNYREMFRLLGLEDKLKIIEGPVIVEKLTVSDMAFEHDVYVSPQVRDLYAYIRKRGVETSHIDTARFGKKVLLTRSGMPHANKDEVNIDRIDKMFAEAGYTIVSPERYTPAELATILDGCESVASYSGSTAHNFVLANPASNCHLAILERSPHRVTYQISLDKFMGISPDYVDASFLPRFVTSVGRVVLYGATTQLTEFASDNGFDMSVFSQKRSILRKELCRFLMRDRRYNGEEESLQNSEIETAPLFAEALMDTKEHYSPWLKDHLPVTWYDWLTPRFIVRYLIYMLRQRRK